MKTRGIPIYNFDDYPRIIFKHNIEMYDVDTEMDKYNEWIEENIGVEGDLWCRGFWNYYFKNIEDAMAFKLRWS